MKQFTFAYYGEPKFENPQAGMAYKERWMLWMKSLGDALVNPGVPTKKAKVVSTNGISDDVSAFRLTGFSIVKAENMDVALGMAKRCPHLEHGTLHVAEAMEMGM